MTVTRTFDLLERFKTLYPQNPVVFSVKRNGSWVSSNINEIIEKSNQFSYGLMSMGFKQGDKIATVSNNRPEWNIIDMGVAQIGVVHVPIYTTLSIDDFSYIFNHAEPRVLIVSDKTIYGKLKPIADKIHSIEYVFSINELEGIPNWNDIIEKGKENSYTQYTELERIKSLIQPSQLATLIYTSGTTGEPKGVMLSHHNLVSNFIATAALHNLHPGSRSFSFLPLSHIYERTINYHCLYKGISIYYAENIGTLIENMKEVKPHLFCTVPRLMERIYSEIIGKGKDLPYFKKLIFLWAVNLGKKYNQNKKNSRWFTLKRKLADQLVFSKWREALGGHIKYIVSGGATLPPQIARVFGTAGFEILEGYGLTETSPVIAVCKPLIHEVRYGTVGTVLEGVEVKLATDGEILCKGPGVMMGYYKAPELTREVIDKEGWFHTGDVGVWVDHKYLKITDRKKEIFKLSNGKYIAPQVIENRFKESRFIEQIMVFGENEKFASALISPNFLNLTRWCMLHNISCQDNNELIAFHKVIEKYQREVGQINKSLGQTEQIKRFRLVSDEWSTLSGELSQTLKIKRKYIFEKYKDIISEIYSVRNQD